MRRVDRRTAFHEAGHAVAVFLFGGRVTYISAMEDTRWGGICSWTDSLGAVQSAVVAYTGRLAEARAAKAGARAMPIASAPPGERPDLTLTASADTSEADLDAADALSRVQRNHEKWGTASTDEDCAFDYIADITSSSLEEIQTALDMIRLRARALVRDEKFQFLLDHLAGVLLDRGHLDGDTAMDELMRCELRFDSASREPSAAQE